MDVLVKTDPPVGHDVHVNFHAPQDLRMSYQVYSRDQVRVDVGPGLSLFLTVEALDCLRRQLDAARTEIANESAYVDPLKKVWDTAAAIL